MLRKCFSVVILLAEPDGDESRLRYAIFPPPLAKTV